MQIRGLFSILTLFTLVMAGAACRGDTSRDEPAGEPMAEQPRA